MERDTNRWESFSLKELLTLRVELESPTSLNLAMDLHSEIARRYVEQDKKAETRTTSEYLAAAAEAVRRSDVGQAGEGAVARRAETHALRDAVRAIIQHLEERP